MRRPYRLTTTTEIARARKLRADGRSSALIAFDLDRSPGWVMKWAPPPKTRSERFDERMARAHALRMEGKTRMEVAGMLGIKSERILSVSLSRWRRQHRPEEKGRYPSMWGRPAKTDAPNAYMRHTRLDTTLHRRTAIRSLASRSLS